MYSTEDYTKKETSILNQYFTNVDRPVFAIYNLPEVVKGALFARYSRTTKSLRRLFLDEFYSGTEGIFSQPVTESEVNSSRAERLYDRVFSEYGDDSVAQLGSAHVACEQSSNVLTKILERGRLTSYLEQSTRYIFYDKKDVINQFLYYVPPEVFNSTNKNEYSKILDSNFVDYSFLVRKIYSFLQNKYPKSDRDSQSVYNATMRAKACDAARGILPAATKSNVGIFASGQAYERMIIRMNSHPLQEVQDCADMLLEELRKIIPSFLKRVDIEDRGVKWSNYFRNKRINMEKISAITDVEAEPSLEVNLIDWDKDAEKNLLAAALYEYSSISEIQIKRIIETLSKEEIHRIISEYVGQRSNRRHIPGRGAERSYYRFDILSDYGSFRDLQRHRMMTVEWQRLTTNHGYITPELIDEVGEIKRWNNVMSRSEELFHTVNSISGENVAQYVVPFAFKIRYVMQMNIREAFHLLELRTSRQGHPDYRRICQEMHTLIRDKAGHKLIANSMKYVDYQTYELERLEAERRNSNKTT